VVKVALRNPGAAVTVVGVAEGSSMGAEVEVDVGGDSVSVGSGASGVGDWGTCSSTSNVQAEIKKAISMKRADIFLIVNPHEID
jgi:hypothetical protein